MKYKVLTPLDYNQTRYNPGEVLVDILPESEAKLLVSEGIVEEYNENATTPVERRAETVDPKPEPLNSQQTADGAPKAEPVTEAKQPAAPDATNQINV